MNFTLRLRARAALAALTLTAALAPLPAHATTLVATGHVTGMEATDHGPDCPPTEICMSWFFRFAIDIDETLSGGKLPAKIRAARLQHGQFTPAHLKALRLFVLEPIEDADQRRKLQADYYLRQVSPEHQLFCLEGTPEGLGLGDKTFVAIENPERFCFQLRTD